MQKAYLVLEDGTVWEGEGFGASGTAYGELVFTTGMTGCTESLTDPSYFGQIVLFTFPLFGNYGIAKADQESGHCHLRGVVVREHCKKPSNFRCDLSVAEFLGEQDVIGICGIDTRALTQLIREKGVLCAAVTTEDPASVLDAIRTFRITGAVAQTSTPEAVTLLPKKGAARYSVVLMDYGAKKSIAESLLARNCKVTVFPHDTPAETVLAIKPDGIILSDGPGNPADNLFCIEQIQKLLGQAPLFGICLGHQMMARAMGAETVKLKFGHRGANQPVRDLKSGRIYITSQNHGYTVEPASLKENQGELRYVNVNDGSCEGIDYPNLRAFSLQFHPASHEGPLDAVGAFDQFIAMMGGY